MTTLKKTARKTDKKLEYTLDERCTGNRNPSFTKRGPGRYHVQGKQKRA